MQPALSHFTNNKVDGLSWELLHCTNLVRPIEHKHEPTELADDFKITKCHSLIAPLKST